ncbi:c-type cytochrome [Olivibacter domesticus]|uniref:Cytochrome c n=1 Tax=Olivibacter domesticus TaxID=407022 RepID=A0A1H7HXE7_OLID1|nr:cytochrome c [Olivibacter domesticus]SEK53830.1 Cytochrome c [Olivibacter domesticus]
MRNPLISILFVCAVILVLANACQGEEEIKKAQFFANGKSLYTSNCENCHSQNGEGLSDLYPPLTDTSFLRGHRNQLACFVKYGIGQQLTVDNRKFDTKMPANSNLTDQEIAYILTYIGNSFGNELGLISTEEVSTSLKNCEIVE